MFFVYFFFSSRRRHTRCALVTGVQTCALPIYAETRAKCRAAWNAWVGPSDPLYLIYAVNQFNGIRAARDARMAEDRQARSEERRVGKECVSKCRSRWSPDN